MNLNDESIIEYLIKSKDLKFLQRVASIAQGSVTDIEDNRYENDLKEEYPNINISYVSKNEKGAKTTLDIEFDLGDEDNLFSVYCESIDGSDLRGSSKDDIFRMKLEGPKGICCKIYMDNHDREYDMEFGECYEEIIQKEKQKYFDEFIMDIGSKICPWDFRGTIKRNPFCPKDRYPEFYQTAYAMARELGISIVYLDMAYCVVNDHSYPRGIKFDDDLKPEDYPKDIAELIAKLIEMK